FPASHPSTARSEACLASCSGSTSARRSSSSARNSPWSIAIGARQSFDSLGDAMRALGRLALWVAGLVGVAGVAYGIYAGATWIGYAREKRPAEPAAAAAMV